MKPNYEWGPFPPFRILSIMGMAFLALFYLLVTHVFLLWDRKKKARAMLCIYLVAVVWGFIYFCWAFNTDQPAWLGFLYLPVIAGADLFGGILGRFGLVIGVGVGFLPYILLGMVAYRRYLAAPSASQVTKKGT